MQMYLKYYTLKYCLMGLTVVSSSSNGERVITVLNGVYHVATHLTTTYFTSILITGVLVLY